MVQQGAAAGSSAEQSRIVELISAIPAATRVIIVMNVSVYIYTLFYPTVVFAYQICPLTGLIRNEWWRIVTAAFFHASPLPMHILMNMMSFFYLGIRLENKFGTLCFLGLNLMINFFSGVFFVVMGFFLNTTNIMMVGCAIGYSGVLFGLMVIDCKLSTTSTRSIFGFCSVPVWAYPVVMLVMLQVMLPNISFVGHLSGLLVGWIYTKGFLNFLTLSIDRIRSFEGREGIFAAIVNRTSYQLCPVEPVIQQSSAGSSGAWSSISSILDRPRAYWRNRSSSSPSSGSSPSSPRQTVAYEPVDQAAQVDRQLGIEMEPNQAVNNNNRMNLPRGAPLGGRNTLRPSAPPQPSAPLGTHHKNLAGNEPSYPPSSATVPSAPPEEMIDMAVPVGDQQQSVSTVAIAEGSADFDPNDIQQALQKSLQEQ